jgi:hypothetical protein
MKVPVTDAVVVHDNLLIVNVDGLVKKMAWGKMQPIASFNLPTYDIRLMRAMPGLLVTVRESSLIEVWDIESGNKLKEFDTGIIFVEYLSIIQSYAIIGRRSV